MKGFIYKLNFSAECKDFYIGSTANPKKRLYGHKYMPSKKIKSMTNVYGRDNLQMTILEECEYQSVKTLRGLEQHYIDKLKPTVNQRMARDIHNGKCEHGRQKASCKDCKGKNVCIHNKFRIHCRECGGSRVCPHKLNKSDCVECGGGSICEHNKLRRRCMKCSYHFCYFCDMQFDGSDKLNAHMKKQNHLEYQKAFKFIHFV